MPPSGEFSQFFEVTESLAGLSPTQLLQLVLVAFALGPVTDIPLAIA